MGRFSELSDHEMDELFANAAHSTDGSGEGLAAFLGRARLVLSARPDDTTEARHVTGMVETAQLLDSAGRAVRVADPPTRRRLVPNLRVPSLAAKLGLAGGLALVGFGGTAYAGVLPDSIQRTAASVAGTIGVSIPDDGQQGQVDSPDVGQSDDGQQGQVDSPDEGQSDDGQQGQVDGSN